jgi:multimeric flavodoxin WrbA
MRTLILNGSPRKNGDTVNLISAITKHLNGEIKIVNAYFDKISPCIDCRHCNSNDNCIMNDDMQDIYEYLISCDNFIIASPLYFSELTGQLLSVLSRLQMFWASKFVLHKNIIENKKNGVLVVTAGNKGDTKSAENTSSIIFKLLDTEVIGTVFSLNTDTIPTIKDTIAIENAHKIALKLNNLYENKQKSYS